MWSVGQSVERWSGTGCSAGCAISCGLGWLPFQPDRSWSCGRYRRRPARVARRLVMTSTAHYGGCSARVPSAPRARQTLASADDRPSCRGATGCFNASDAGDWISCRNRPGRSAVGDVFAVLPPVDLPGVPTNLPVFPELQRVCDRGADRARDAAGVVVDGATVTSLWTLAPWRGGPGPSSEITPLPRRE